MPQQAEFYRFIVRPLPGRDPQAAVLLQDAQVLGIHALSGLERRELFFIEGQVNPEDLARIAHELLSDPLTQTVEWGRMIPGPGCAQSGAIVDVALRPGVTDPVAEQVVRAAKVLGIQGLWRAATGQRYCVQGEALDEMVLHRLAQRLLANAVIQRYALGEIEPVFPHPAESSGYVEVIPLRHLNPEALLDVSRQRRAALDLAEMEAIQRYYQSEGREPTDVEFEMIAQTWSEHCVHKTFRARITLQGVQGPTTAPEEGAEEEINGLLRTYIRAATEQIQAEWVRSAFVDNAGIIDFGESYEVSFKVETHNHPSAIEPFGGANTGVGGVIRDVLGVSAKPIAATDVLCFGPQDVDAESLPEGVLHPRRIQSGVVAGVQDYGNKIGIPTVNGAILYDPGYTANPLVFCGCIGLAPKGSHPRQAQEGDHVIVLGGRTGRDGLRGATFSSMTMDAQTGEVAGASVQIGDPITEKGVIEVVLRARDQRLYHAITDCGAGGLSSAVGEMSSTCGAQVELNRVRLKYPGLAPWEIWLSEAQERMVLAVPADSLEALCRLCELFDVEMTDIGTFHASGRLVVRYNGQAVVSLDNHFLHEGIPQRQLKARLPQPALSQVCAVGTLGEVETPNATLLRLLAAPNLASKEAVIRLYDHEVQGGTVIKPLSGVLSDAPSDGCVLKPAGTSGRGGIVLANGINPQYGKADAYRMALSVVDEAVRNAVALGANPQRLALLDNFCWGDPKRPETLGSLVQAARGCYEAALHYQTPFISGKDSLNNEYLGTDGERHAIPPTLLISAMGLIEDVSRACSMDLKAPGDVLYLVGTFEPVLEGVPGLPAGAPQLYQALHAAIQQGWVRACHDLSEGGLAAAAAEMCIGGRLGLELHLRCSGQVQAQQWLFGEVNGCLLVEVSLEREEQFQGCLAGCAWMRLGEVMADPRLVLAVQVPGKESTGIDLPVDVLVRSWKRAVI